MTVGSDLSPPGNGPKPAKLEPDSERYRPLLFRLWRRKTTIVAALALTSITAHLTLRFGFRSQPNVYEIPLLITLVIGGMALSIIGMALAATGHLTPVAGAISQEVIDVRAVLNALRAAFLPKVILYDL